MKKLLIIIAILAVAVGIYYWNKDEEKEPTEVTATYTDTTAPISFEYRENPEGYVLEVRDNNGVVPELVKTITLMERADYYSIERGEREGGEGPPVISLQIFTNTHKHTPASWTPVHAHHNNYPLIQGEVTETTVAGEPAVTYNADGLYPNKNVVVAHGDFIYYINGSYLEQDSNLYRDFPEFLDSIKFN